MRRGTDRPDPDLARLVDAARAAAARLGAEPVDSPWLPPLPEVVTVDDLAGLPVADDRLTIGLLDLPVRAAPGTGDLRPRRR